MTNFRAQSMGRQWRRPLAYVFVACLVLAACQTVPATPDSAPQAQAKKASDKSAVKATLVEGTGGRVWSLTPSADLTYAEARAHCQGQPPHQGGAWQLPSFYQLARAPLAVYKFPSGTRLWSDTAPERLPLKRFLVDSERPFGRYSTDLRDGERFPALCTATPPS